MNALPDRIRILVLVNDLDAFEIVRNPWPDRIEFIEVPSDVDLTTWPQDPFLVVDNAEEGKSLITSRAFSRARDIEMGGFVAAKMGWLHEHSQLSFEGGNLVSDEETSFIGGNTIRINAAELKLTEKEVARHFALLLGRRIVVIGPVPQPVGHIDMILTPLGGGKILLADPNWGAEIAERELLDSPRQVEDFELRAEEMFFGHPEIHELKQPDEQTIKRPELVGRTGEAVADSRELAGALDSIAQELVSQGFGVERVPYLSVRSSNPETNGVVGSRAAGPNYPVLTYNNVLIEEAGGEQHAYVPRYSLDALDREGHAVWRNLGYRVHPIDELTTSATYGGSLRCAVKVLAR
ncbi:MAG TPA: hypothetical protein EYQ54_14485 [Myxococcales bacterium]|nr:hypothetical protein [Myxococcales bacterium]